MVIVGDVNALTYKIIGCAMQVHRELGPGMRENIYEIALADELRAYSVAVERQYPVTLYRSGRKIGEAFEVDLLVEGRVIVEVKSARALPTVFFQQTLGYARALELPVALLLNFGTQSLQIRRIVNRL